MQMLKAYVFLILIAETCVRNIYIFKRAVFDIINFPDVPSKVVPS